MGVRNDVPGKPVGAGPGPHLCVFKHLAGDCDGIPDHGVALLAYEDEDADRRGCGVAIGLLGRDGVDPRGRLWRRKLYAGW